jgi:hypothetical protein
VHCISNIAVYSTESNLNERVNRQYDSGGKVNILGRDSIGHCEKKGPYEHVLIPNGYPDRAVGNYNYTSIVSGSK